MSVKSIFYITFFLLSLVLASEGHCDSHLNRQNIFTLNYPPDKTIMEFELLSISLKISQDSVDLISANVNDVEKIRIFPDSEFECFSIPLEIGTNRINLTAIKEDRLIGEIIFNVFRRSDLESKFKEPPAGFKKDYFHMKENSQCAPCHIMEPTGADKKSLQMIFSASENKAVVDASSSTCYSCHKRIIAYPFVHGPASVWSCLSCHDPQAEPKYSVKKPVTKICLSCHLEHMEKWNAKKYFHGPSNTGKCSICHNPHASENPSSLFKPIWDLCVSCHIDKGDGRHIVEGYVNTDSHPTHGKPDPLREGKELTCASCHNSHASDSPKLWRLDIETGIALCKECHRKPIKNIR